MGTTGAVRAATLEWASDAARLGLSRPLAARVLRDIRDAYASPGRHYHTLGHALSVVRGVERQRARLRDPAAARLAAWFHDAVYDPRRGDNEARSAALARASLRRAGVPLPVVREACRLILLTRTHDCRLWDCDAAVLLDADLAILGAGRRRYAEYARAVRREYAWVPADAFRRGRLRILREFLRRRRLFRTPAMRARLEARARRNIRAECDRLARVVS